LSDEKKMDQSTCRTLSEWIVATDDESVKI
jgi:hypothetical protein